MSTFKNIFETLREIGETEYDDPYEFYDDLRWFVDDKLSDKICDDNCLCETQEGDNYKVKRSGKYDSTFMCIECLAMKLLKLKEENERLKEGVKPPEGFLGL